MLSAQYILVSRLIILAESTASAIICSIILVSVQRRKLFAAILLSGLAIWLGACAHERRRHRYPAPIYQYHPTPGSRDINPGYEQAGGLLESKSLYSKEYNEYIHYSILLPASYSTSPGRDYPVVYWLHGANGGARSLSPLATRFRKAMGTGLMDEAVVVFPESKPLSMWVDSKNGGYPIESLFIKSLVPHIQNSFRISKDRLQHYIAGFSMGGYGAARLGLKFPNIFGNIVMVGAGTLDVSLDNTPRASKSTKEQVMRNIYGNDENYFYSSSPRSLAISSVARTKPKAKSSITIIVGTSDEVYDQNIRFSDYLKRAGYETRFIPLPGVHHSLKEYVRAAHVALFGSL